jgi:hypothetical protein
MEEIISPIWSTMSDNLQALLSLQTVPLTREKQMDIQEEVTLYHDATNYTIKMILKKRLTTFTKTVEELMDKLSRKYVYLRNSSGPLSELNNDQLRDTFARRFTLDVVKSRLSVERHQNEIEEVYIRRSRKDFALLYESQYVKDIVKSARVEIGKHRRLAHTLRSIRDKQPYFKEGRIIFSKPILQISKEGKAFLLLTSAGKEIPLVFDKYTRNASLKTLDGIVNGKIKYDRVRLTWNREGYLNIDVRLIN